jgi:hypothetical protein
LAIAGIAGGGLWVTVWIVLAILFAVAMSGW